MSENTVVESSEVLPRETSRGLRTLGTTTGFDLILAELTPEQIARVWNRHLALEGKEALALSGASKTRVVQSFSDFRRVFRDAFRRDTRKNGDLSFEPSGELSARVKADEAKAEESKVEPALTWERVGSGPSPKPVSPPVRVGRALSALEQRMFVASARTGHAAPMATPDAMFDAEMAALLAKAADEAKAEGQLKSDFILWACNRADEILTAHHQREGETLWANPILVESFPSKPEWRVVYVCSSTAPLLRDPAIASPIVKHDFRANDVPVTHSHPSAFKQADGMKIIRSKVLKRGAHEYYVKALEYVDGTFFKGYFVVDGVEDAQSVPPRYYQIRGGTVVPITEHDYKGCQNRLAAKKPLLP